MQPTRLLPLLALAAMAACTDDTLMDPAPDFGPTASVGSPATNPISVQTRNVYVGADVDAVIAAVLNGDPNDDLPALLAAIAEFQATSFPDRAAALAAEIARYRPHVVGLQEISTIDANLPALGLVFTIDYLPILLAHLAGHDLDYVPVASVVGATAMLPGVELVDRDVILVDADRATWDPASIVEQTYAANLGMVGGGVNLTRGFVSVDVTVNGTTIKVASTHLESGNQPGFDLLRAGQATELVGFLGAASPAVVMGDLNDPPGTPMYNVVTGSGFVDAWAAMRPGTIGFTCCHASDLSNQVAGGEFDQRIDYIMTRGLGHRNGSLLGGIGLLGITPGEQVDGPLHDIWPSDHAGLVLEVVTPPGGAF